VELQNIDEVKEASLVLGGNSDTDAIVKIEAPLPQLNDIILRSIGRNRHVVKTQTLQAISGTRWQREQPNYDAKLNETIFAIDPESINNNRTSSGAEITNVIDSFESRSYPSNWFRELFMDKIQCAFLDIDELNKGIMTLKKYTDLASFPRTVVDAAKKIILAVVVWDKIGKGEHVRTKQYLNMQAEKIKREDFFEIRRIFVLENFEVFETDMRLRQRIQDEIKAGIKVKLIMEEDCEKVRTGYKPIDFGVIDDAATWVLNNGLNYEKMRVIDISIESTDIQRNIRTHEAMWDNLAQEPII